LTLAGIYGGVGAIDFFGSRYGLPKSITAHQNYYYWGPRQYTGESIILLEWKREDAQYWAIIYLTDHARLSLKPVGFHFAVMILDLSLICA
jgi:hypothetical protein